MKNIIITTMLLLLVLSARQSYAQCTATISGGGCEGTTLTANTTNGTLEQLIWKWKSREDSVVLVSTATAHYPAGITVAGGNGYDNANGDAPNNQCDPRGIYVDKTGSLYVVDAPGARVQKWLPGATEGIIVAGGNGYGEAANQLEQPYYIQVDEQGNIYISDGGNNRIQKWAPGATEGVTVAGGPDKNGSGPDQFNGVGGIFLDKQHNLYVADAGNYRIQKFAPGATSGMTVAGGNGDGTRADQIAYANGIFVDATGNIFIADGGYYNNRVEKWTPGATTGIIVAGTTLAGSSAKQLHGPKDVFVDSVGSIYIADAFNDRIQKWVPGADSGVTVAHNGFAVGVFVTGDTFYYSDAGNLEVQKYIPGVEGSVINKTYKPTNGGTYTVTAVFKEGCTVTSPSVHIKGLPKFTSIKGQHRNLCGGGDFTYSVNDIEDAVDYVWTAPEGCNIISGQGTPAITLHIPATGFISGTLSVSAANRCGRGPIFNDTLSTKPGKPPVIEGPVFVKVNDTVVYSVAPQPGINYSWEVPVQGVVILSGQNTPSVTVKWSTFAAGGNVVVHAATCGAASSGKLTVTTDYAGKAASATSSSALVATALPGNLKVYPNPAQNTATVAFAATGSYTIQLSDAVGKVVKTIKGNGATGNNTISLDLSRLSKGIYFVTLTDKDGKKQVVTLSKQ